VIDGILYFEGPEVNDHRCVVVSSHLRQKLLDKHHDMLDTLLQRRWYTESNSIIAGVDYVQEVILLCNLCVSKRTG